MTDFFDRDFFTVLRKERGVDWGGQLYIFEEIGSTNDEALAAIAKGAETGSVWLARSQFSGRGRRGNVWHADPGESLLMSCLLRYEGSLERFMGLSLVVGLAVLDVVKKRIPAVEQTRRTPLLKWPNDVYVGESKIAGILVETRGSTGGLGTVIGVGLNVATTAFPPNLPAATSLRLLGAADADIRLEIVLVDFLGALQARIERFLSEGLSPFVEELKAVDFLLGRSFRVGKVEGTGAGIQDDGQLLVSTEAGITPVMSGTVELI